MFGFTKMFRVLLNQNIRNQQHRRYPALNTFRHFIPIHGSATHGLDVHGVIVSEHKFDLQLLCKQSFCYKLELHFMLVILKFQFLPLRKHPNPL